MCSPSQKQVKVLSRDELLETEIKIHGRKIGPKTLRKLLDEWEKRRIDHVKDLQQAIESWPHESIPPDEELVSSYLRLLKIEDEFGIREGLSELLLESIIRIIPLLSEVRSPLKEVGPEIIGRILLSKLHKMGFELNDRLIQMIREQVRSVYKRLSDRRRHGVFAYLLLKPIPGPASNFNIKRLSINNKSFEVIIEDTRIGEYRIVCIPSGKYTFHSRDFAASVKDSFPYEIVEDDIVFLIDASGVVIAYTSTLDESFFDKLKNVLKRISPYVITS